MICRPLLFLCLIVSFARSAETGSLPNGVSRIAPDDPTWRELASAFAHQPDGVAEFSEQRFFPFKKEPVRLKGESRISTSRGLSLHYTEPVERVVIIDARGVLMRDGHGEDSGITDPRASAANAALVQVLRFDLTALASNFEIYGRRDGEVWQLVFVPRAADLRRNVGQIIVAGGAGTVNRIEIRRSAKQYVAIQIGPSRPVAFTANELKHFFR